MLDALGAPSPCCCSAARPTSRWPSPGGTPPDRPLRVVLAARPTQRRAEAAAELAAAGLHGAARWISRRGTPPHTRPRSTPPSPAATSTSRWSPSACSATPEEAWTDPDALLELIEVNYTAPAHLGVLLAEPDAGAGPRPDRGAVQRGRRTGPPVQLRVRLDQGRAGRVLSSVSVRRCADHGVERAGGPPRLRPLQDDRGLGRGAAGRDARGGGRRGRRRRSGTARS